MGERCFKASTEPSRDLEKIAAKLQVANHGRSILVQTRIWKGDIDMRAMVLHAV